MTGKPGSGTTGGGGNAPSLTRFMPWKGGVCEVNTDGRTGPYCNKAARWWDGDTQLILCGEHKREVERRARP